MMRKVERVVVQGVLRRVTVTSSAVMLGALVRVGV